MGISTATIKNVLIAVRLKFLTASIAPVLVGTALAFASTGTIDWLLFILAALSIAFLHAGSNNANDYFDHLSGTDWINQNITPFSAGSQAIQKGLLTPQAILLLALFLLSLGSLLGLIVLWLTQNLLVLILGLAGLLGGFFYTAPPIKLAHRGVGEFVIGLMFGVFPVCGAFAIQTGFVNSISILTGGIVGLLVFLIILINEFPDLQADRNVGKRNLVVRFGVATSVWVYRIVLFASYVIAAVLIYFPVSRWAGSLFMLTFVLTLQLLRCANEKQLAVPGNVKANAMTILLHLSGSLALAIGFLITGILSK